MELHDDDDDVESSRERAMADVEMLCAAYPDEVVREDEEEANVMDLAVLKFTLQLSTTAKCQLQILWNEHYPTLTNIQIASYRCRPGDKARMEATLTTLRAAAQECLDDGVEGCLPCTAAALEVWQNHETEPTDSSLLPLDSVQPVEEPTRRQHFQWYSGEPMVVQKSSFVGHVCRIHSASQVPLALDQLIGNNSKLQRASHNMSAYRVQEVNGVWKSDNDEDGEHGAGKHLSHLLEMRNENQVLVVVSRWFGGILLGPRRFAYITNCARNSLEEFRHLAEPSNQAATKHE